VSAADRSKLAELRNLLLKLHKTLLDSECAVYERDVARLTSRGQLLGLVLHDPWFAWLHELSELVVLIDETLDAEDAIPGAESERLLAQARALLVPRENGGGFARRYFEALQRDPDVVLAHGKTVKRLAEMA